MQGRYGAMLSLWGGFGLPDPTTCQPRPCRAEAVRRPELIFDKYLANFVAIFKCFLGNFWFYFFEIWTINVILLLDYRLEDQGTVYD